MIQWSRDWEVYLCCEPVDFRRGIRTLSVFVEESMGLNPFATQLFIFGNRRRDAVKILYWARNGFCLWQKRLERERFHWPPGDSPMILSHQQLTWLLDGYDIGVLKPHQELHYESVL